METPLTDEEFCQAGRKLYGKRWKSPLARALGVDRVTVWRYAIGALPIPRAVELAMQALLSAGR